MLYLGIDQHRKQLTVCVRDEQGELCCGGRSARGPRVREFLGRAAAGTRRATWRSWRCAASTIGWCGCCAERRPVRRC